MSNDPIVDLLKPCCAQIKSPSLGTAFFVSPRLALTCAHVVKDCEEGDSVKLYFQGGELTGTIEKLNRPADFCIISFARAVTGNHVILNEDLLLGDQVFGWGYPVIGERNYVAGFLGRYETPAFRLETNYADIEILKIQYSLISPGHSGSPIINIRTGRCIGMIKQTRDRNNDIGGNAVAASDMLAELQRRQELYRGMNGNGNLWDEAINQYHQRKNRTVSAKKVSVALRYDQAYHCDRDEISVIFKNHFFSPVSGRAPSIAHYLITGMENHSPLGVARKLISETAVRTPSASIFYPGDPNDRDDNTRFQIRTDTHILEFLEALCIGLKIPVTIDLGRHTREAICRHIINGLKKWTYTVVPVTVRMKKQETENTDMLGRIKEFINVFNQASRTCRAKIMFFWCFTWDSPDFERQAGFISQQFSTMLGQEPEPGNTGVVGGYAMAGSKKILEGGRTLIWLVNEQVALAELENHEIETWVTWLNNVKPEHYQVRSGWMEEIQQLKNTTKIENEFLKIIHAFNTSN